MKDWPQVRLADAFRLEMGKTPDRGNTAYWNSNRKWASIADIGRSGMFLVDTKEKISDRAIAETGIKSVPANTIVMSFKLSIGKTAITKDELFTNEAIMAFHPLGPKLFDLHFLYHLFSNKDWAAGCNKAVKGVTLNKATLREVRILCPPLEVQEQMAKVLDGICAIVEQTQNQIAKLDQLGKSRFVEMFGECEDLVSLDQVGQIFTGSTPPMKISEYYDSDDIPFVKPSDLSFEISQIVTSDCFLSKKADPVVRMFDPGAVLVTCIGATIGKMGVARVRGTCNQQINFVVPSSKIKPEFLALALQSKKDELVRSANSTAVPILNKSQFSKIQLPLPPIGEQRKFAAFVAEVDKSKFAVRKRLEKARQLYRAKLQEYFG